MDSSELGSSSGSSPTSLPVAARKRAPLVQEAEEAEASTPRPRRPGRLLAALVFGGLTFGAAALGSRVSKKKVWYGSLRKSQANPPSWVFAPVWSTLYATIAYSGYRTWRGEDSPARSRALGLWGVQLALNASWTPLFFGSHLPKASAAVAAALVPAVGAYALTARKVDKPAAAMMLPYLAWSMFATYLNAQILRKNSWRF